MGIRPDPDTLRDLTAVERTVDSTVVHDNVTVCVDRESAVDCGIALQMDERQYTIRR